MLSELVLFILEAILGIGFIVSFTITGILLASARGKTVKPNCYYPDHHEYYPCHYSKGLKVSAMIALAYVVIGLPWVIVWATVFSITSDPRSGVIPASIVGVIGLFFLIYLGLKDWAHKEEVLLIDKDTVTIKYKDTEKQDLVHHISRYDHFEYESKYNAAKLIFMGHEGVEEVRMNFLRNNDALTVGKMVDFIKRNGRMPVVQNVQHAPSKFVERRKTEAEAEVKKAAQAQNELVNDYRKYPRYLEDVLSSKLNLDQRAKYADMILNGQKNEAVRDCQRTCGEGLRIVVDLVERYLSFPDLRMYSSKIYMSGCTREQILESLDEYGSIYTEPVFNSAPTISEVNDSSWMMVEVDCKFTDYINLVLWLSELDKKLFAYAKPFKEDMAFVYAVPDKTDRNGETCIVYKADASWQFNVPELLLKWKEPLPDLDIKSYIKDHHGVEI